MTTIKKLLYIGQPNDFFTFKSIYHAKVNADGKVLIQDDIDKKFGLYRHESHPEWFELNFIEVDEIEDVIENTYDVEPEVYAVVAPYVARATESLLKEFNIKYLDNAHVPFGPKRKSMGDVAIVARIEGCKLEVLLLEEKDYLPTDIDTRLSYESLMELIEENNY